MATFFREVRAAADSRFLGTSEDSKTITVWDGVKLRMVCVVEPGFDGGEDRFAIDTRASKIYSGIWESGLSCYDYATHKTLWQRKDLIGIQRVDVSDAFPSSVFVAMETPDYRVDEPGMFTGVMELDRASGKKIWQGDYFGGMYLHPSKAIFVVVDGVGKCIRIFDKQRKQRGLVKMINFAVLDVAFDDTRIALAEGKMGIRVIDFQGKVLSKHCPTDRQPNCTAITFDATSGNVAVNDSWEGFFMTIVDPATGKVIHEYQQSSGRHSCFFNNGASYLNNQGQVFRTADGALQNAISN